MFGRILQNEISLPHCEFEGVFFFMNLTQQGLTCSPYTPAVYSLNQLSR